MISYDQHTVYPKKYAHGFCFAVLCCGYTLTDFRISIRLTSLALWQSNDCPSASKATLMNMDRSFMWIHYERLHNHNKASTTKPCAYFLGYTVDAAFCRHSTTRELCTWFAFCCVLVLSSLNRSHPHILLNCFFSTVIVRKPVKLPWWIWVNEWHDCAKIWRCKHDNIIHLITSMSTTPFSLEFHQCTWNIYLEYIRIHICYSCNICICMIIHT